MDYLAKFKKSPLLKLESQAVAVPELKHMFEPNEPTLIYVATLTGIEKDEMDLAYLRFIKRMQVSEDSQELYRSFCLAYCLSDSQNVRAAENDQLIDALFEHVSGFPNKIIRRMWNVCNGANGFFGVEDDLKKESTAATPAAKSTDGNGE